MHCIYSQIRKFGDVRRSILHFTLLHFTNDLFRLVKNLTFKTSFSNFQGQLLLKLIICKTSKKNACPDSGQCETEDLSQLSLISCIYMKHGIWRKFQGHNPSMSRNNIVGDPPVR